MVPDQKYVNLAPSCLNLVVSFATIYFSFLSLAGMSFVAYHTTVGSLTNLSTAFQASKKLFWRVVALSFLLLVFFAPCAFVFAFSFWRFLQIKDFPHVVLLTSIPLSIFTAMWYFPITEAIANDSKIGKSLRAAWTVFTSHFVNLTIIGLLLIGALHLINIVISIAVLLVQSGFDISALSQLDFIYPQLSFLGNRFYELLLAIPQAAWQAYSISIFTVAYLEYNSAKMSKHSTLYSKKPPNTACT